MLVLLDVVAGVWLAVVPFAGARGRNGWPVVSCFFLVGCGFYGCVRVRRNVPVLRLLMGGGWVNAGWLEVGWHRIGVLCPFKRYGFAM